MNTLLWSKEYKEVKIAALSVDDETLKVVFSDASNVSFTTLHEQDCCESVYGDFSIAQYHEKELLEKELVKLEVKSIKEMGFLLCFYCKWENSEKIFIPCYNSQNGYYSSDLYLTINDNGSETTIDISDSVEDQID